MLRILVTYPQALPHETRLITNLMEEDWDFLHVRKPDYDKDELINFLEMIPQYHHKVVLHSHYELMRDFDVAGINITGKALANLTYEDELTSSCDIRELCVKDGQVYCYGMKPDLVSYSAHGFSEIQQLNFETGYVFLSPIFDSISKPNYTSKFEDHDILSDFLHRTNRRVIALGGVDNDKLTTCSDLGFDGYAMLGSIWTTYFTFIETIQ